jgi:hypothetical protein
LTAGLEVTQQPKKMEEVQKDASKEREKVLRPVTRLTLNQDCFLDQSTPLIASGRLV